MEVSTNLDLLYIGIPPCDLYLDTPTSSRRYIPCFHSPMYFGFVGHYSWGVRCPKYLCPLIVQDIMTETYKPTLFQQNACFTTNRLLHLLYVKRGVLEV